jgi:hypothetical protein
MKSALGVSCFYVSDGGEGSREPLAVQAID